MKNVNDILAGYSGVESEMGSVAIKGRSGREAEVTASYELAVTNESPYEQALNAGNAYIWTTATADINAGDTMLAIRNNSSTQDLIITDIYITNGNVDACIYDIHIVTAAYTNAGTAVTGATLNTNYANAAPVDATQDETGNTQGKVLMEFTAEAATRVERIPLPGIRLKSATALAVDQITESTAGSVMMVGYFVDV
jgi:hypothetical protein